MKLVFFFLSVVFLGVFPTNQACAASFQGLGIVESEENDKLSYSAWDVSADGSVVVGDAWPNYEAFRWTVIGGAKGLGSFTDYARGVSPDGSIIVGMWNGDAYRWTRKNGYEPLNYYIPDDPEPEPYVLSGTAWATSADGSVVVGESFRWTEANATPDTEVLPNLDFAAYDVSADGSVVVGEGFRWTEANGKENLKVPPDGSTFAQGVSSDGSVVVGQSIYGYLNGEAFRWTEADGIVGLGDLGGGEFFSVALDTNADGSIIVGSGTIDEPFNISYGDEAFIWDNVNGMRSLKEVLINEYGLDLDGWDLQVARAITDDGSVIVGWGTNPSGDTEAWRAVLGPAKLYKSRIKLQDLDGSLITNNFSPGTAIRYRVKFKVDGKPSEQYRVVVSGKAFSLYKPDGTNREWLDKFDNPQRKTKEINGGETQKVQWSRFIPGNATPDKTARVWFILKLKEYNESTDSWDLVKTYKWKKTFNIVP